jgi:hypothetical protein
MVYKQPKPLFEWKIDEPEKELYSASILDNQTVLLSYGRYAHSSGSKSVSWQEFIAGGMNELVENTMGEKALIELLNQLKKLT